MRKEKRTKIKIDKKEFDVFMTQIVKAHILYGAEFLK